MDEKPVLAGAGHKHDSWFAIDRLTGTKVQTLSVDSASEVCPSSGINQVFIGRTGTFLCAVAHASLSDVVLETLVLVWRCL